MAFPPSELAFQDDILRKAGQRPLKIVILNVKVILNPVGKVEMLPYRTTDTGIQLRLGLPYGRQVVKVGKITRDESGRMTCIPIPVHKFDVEIIREAWLQRFVLPIP